MSSIGGRGVPSSATWKGLNWASMFDPGGPVTDLNRTSARGGFGAAGGLPAGGDGAAGGSRESVVSTLIDFEQLLEWRGAPKSLAAAGKLACPP